MDPLDKITPTFMATYENHRMSVGHDALKGWFTGILCPTCFWHRVEIFGMEKTVKEFEA